MGTAIFIRPVDEEQVSLFLQETGLATVAAVREAAAGLQELAHSPLMLNMMALAYRNLEMSELTGLSSPAAFRRHLFHTYTERMFFHRYREPTHPPEQARASLRWLAQQMVSHRQSILDTFRMQPGWLGPSGERAYWNNIALFGGLLSAVGTAFALAIFFVLPVSSLPFAAGWVLYAFLLTGITMRLQALLNFRGRRLRLKNYAGLIFALLIWLTEGTDESVWLFALVGWLIYRLGHLWPSIGTWNRSATGFICWLLFGLLYGTAGESFADQGWTPHLLLELYDLTASALFFGLMGALITWAIEETGSELEPIESISWSVRRGLVYGIATGLASGLLLGIVGALAIEGTGQASGYGLITGIGAGLLIGVAAAFIWGIRREESVTLATRSWDRLGRHLWHQGWRSSLTLSLSALVTTLLLIGAFAGLSSIWGESPSEVIGEVFRKSTVVWWGLGISAVGGIVVALSYGGPTLLKHLYMRRQIHRRELLPQPLDAFLEEMVDILLLRRAGVGYIFIHRLLMEYLAEEGE
jgi:hypothetical protein